MWKTILVQVDSQPGMTARLQAAAQLAQAHQAHLIGSAATGVSWASYAMLAGAMALSLPDEEFDSLRRRARAALASFASAARALGVASFEERLFEEERAQALLLQGRYADLTVTSPDLDSAGNPLRLGGLAAQLVLHGSRPVLVVPSDYAGAALSERVVLGWDGGSPALRAICASLPLLRQAHQVKLAVLNPTAQSALHGDEPGADMALYLARHGVPVELVNQRSPLPVGDALLALAEDCGAGLLVCGAFGHSRYRELVLGGVTRTLFGRARLPLLLAH